jgi:quinoprotein glucose dehydrogenase
VALLAGATLLPANSSAQTPLDDGWPTYGGDPGGSRYSSASLIDKSNVRSLHPAWTFHTHALDDVTRSRSDEGSFETTPVLFHDTLYLTSPFDVVFALDPATGRERWHHDPHLAPLLTKDGSVTSRGVATWEGPAATPPSECRRRIFLGTLDARLLALDADSGQLCTGFGSGGSVDMKEGVFYEGDGLYGLTSPPTVVGDVVVVGSTIGDSARVDAASGLVRGYDAVKGTLLWSWEPLPWARSQPLRTGAANVWSVISADAALGLVYLPTSAPSPDYYGGLRPGDDRDSDSIVALDVHTGRKVWAFQTTHHDLWDYDVAAEPLLFPFRGSIPAVAVTTKMGMVFVFDRRDGTPLYPITERPVPPSDTPGEEASPTQPFSSLPPLSPLGPGADAPVDFERSPFDRELCSRKVAALRYEGIYTPPAVNQSVLLFPSQLGGVNWSSAALDPATSILYASTNRVFFSTHLLPHGDPPPPPRLERLAEPRTWWLLAAPLLALATLSLRRRNVSVSLFVLSLVAAGIALRSRARPRQPRPPATYELHREPVVDSQGHNCAPFPWGALSALNLDTGQLVWQTTAGTEIAGKHVGSLGFGGPIVTAGGVVFSAGTADPYLRAYDAASGAQLWQGELPAAARATPMTYVYDGEQYVVVAAGGHGALHEGRSDALVAFRSSAGPHPVPDVKRKTGSRPPR